MLRHARAFQSEADYREFDEAIDLFAARMDPSDLPELHRAFDDGTEGQDAYWSLVHLIEDYEPATATKVFLDVLPEMMPSAREWMETLTIRRLNSEPDRHILTAAARAAEPPNRAALQELLDGIAAVPGSEAADAVATRARSVAGQLNQPRSRRLFDRA